MARCADGRTLSGGWKAEGNISRLTLGRMFEATIRDRSDELVL